MSKKKILSFFVYLILFALICLAERVSHFKGFAFSFCLALIFCKENIVCALLPYVICSALIHFDLWYCVSVAICAIIAVLLVAIHYRSNRKYRLWVNIICISISHIPIFILESGSVEKMTTAAVGMIISVIFHYICVVSFYPVLVRGLRYRMSEKELACAALFIIFLGAGLNSFSVFGIKFFFFALAVSIFILSELGQEKILQLSVSAGFGAWLASGSPGDFCCAVMLGGVAVLLRATNKYICAVGVLATYVGSVWLLRGEFDLYGTIPVAVASLVVFIPERVFGGMRGYRQSYQGKFALRTMVNRDRDEVSKKLKGVSSAFRRMETLLEREQPTDVKPDGIVNRICEVCCRNCGRFAVCREKVGDMRVPLKKLVLRGLENGRASMLDADVLGPVCVKLPRIINITNESVREIKNKADRRSGIEQGREMVISNLDGTADLLDELADTVKTGFGFDVDTEKKIIEELGYANIVASDIAIYGESEKINISVRDCDAKKPELVRIISEITGTGMRETEYEKGVNGMVNIVFRPNPNYGVLYGEKSESKESVCGDAKQAVRIANDKLMFVLSDGMGTGEEAHYTGMNTIALIETFYKAGFTHKTIFNCVSKLLALRTSESFSAIDVAIMDTQTGEIDFIKQGGRESYIFTKSGIEVVEGGSLPLGIVDGGEPRIERRVLSENDVVIMISDGVADKLDGADVTEIVSQLNTLNPQTISDKIIENAKNKSGGHEDDMTAMALRVVKNG